ncbi:MAG TPA: methionine--tRNA ligase [Firmicutes bacterium]|nr:methionine--tRNA ligase [Bacillota bacterium]
MTRYLITSALPYINGMKHLGNLVGSMLPADVYARFLRLEGEEVLFICATDEHGTPAEIAALEEGLDVKTYCDIQHQRQKDVYMRFGLSFDYFGRSSSPQNHELTQHFYRMLDKHGFIEERGIQQIYSLDDERFLPDRYVIGTCPKCGYDRARGDQCESCASLLNPSELVEPRSAVSGSRNLELRTSKHLFLKLDTLSSEIENWVKSNTHWPKLTYSVAMKWLNEGLQPRCITRDLSWGVPVPREGYENKVFYVWFDAPIEYVGATKEWADQDPANRDWRSWWYDAGDVYYAQFMAKDNLPFHTIVWPATILGTREPWTMADYIKGFNWLNYYGGKFSTSQGRGVFMDDALDILPPDYWRYFLMSIAPETDDSDFTWDLFASVVNKDLAGTLGNFVNRTLKLVASRLGTTIPEGGRWGEHEDKLLAQCKESIEEYRTALRNFEFRKAALALKKLWTHGNVYIDARAPWNLLKDDPAEAALVLRTCINLIRTYAIASSPLIPFTSEALFDALGMTAWERKAGLDDALDLTALEGGRPFEVPPILFRRLDPDEVETHRKRFAGVEG